MDRRDSPREGVIVINNGIQTLCVASDRFGQYAVNGTVGGQNVSFLIDTGASGISIPQSVANQLNLQKGRAFQVKTANAAVLSLHNSNRHTANWPAQTNKSESSY